MRRGLLLIGAIAGCGSHAVVPAHFAEPSRALAPALSRPNMPARMFPEATEGMPAFGREPGGALRVMKDGRRFLVRPDGGLEVADTLGLGSWGFADPIPQRLGGGFLFRDKKSSGALFRSESWLGPITPFYTHYADVSDIWYGVDRMYLTSTKVARLALDPSGAQVDPGTLPASPHVRGLAAIDGWNALAITDSRGTLISKNAGATWEPAPLPIDPVEVRAASGVFYVQGTSSDNRQVAYVVRRDGTFTEARATPDTDKPQPKPPGVFGAVPLARAVVSGIPLSDGTALVAHAGVLGRIRLSDGIVVEKRDAFDMKSATCAPVPLSRRDATPVAWGFVCGEPRGRTGFYAVEGASLRQIHSFPTPRAVFASGEGALAVRGACEGDERSTANRRAYCVYHPGIGFHEIVLTGNVGAERVVALSDGRVAILTPPALDVRTARLTIIDAQGAGKSTPLVWPTVAAPAQQLLASGLWLDGFEQRGDDRIGGWVTAGTTFLGVEIAMDGNVRIGEHIVDAGNPVVSGRYGLGWTNAGRGFETIDGGFSWQPIDMPPPAPDADKSPERGCSIVGCRLHGWIRVGWGTGEFSRPVPMPAARAPSHPTATPLVLECEGAQEKGPLPTAAPRAATGGRIVDAVADLGSFRGLSSPPLKASERAYVLDATTPLGRHAPKPVGRLVAIGPKAGTWDEQNVSFLVEWASPFEARGRTSALGPAPTFLVEAARANIAPRTGTRRYTPSYYYGGLSITVSNDGRHALVTARRPGVAGLLVYALSEERPPLELKRADGEPWHDVDDALFGDRGWFLTSPSSAQALGLRRPPARAAQARLSIFRAEGGTAREVMSVARPQHRISAPTLIEELGAHRIGVLVEGEAAAGNAAPTLWVTPIDPESDEAGDPEPLAASDLSDVTDLRTCDDAGRGWIWDVVLGNRRVDARGPQDRSVPILSLNARVVSSARGTCMLAMTFGSRDIPLSAPLRTKPNTVLVQDGRTRPLACHVKAR